MHSMVLWFYDFPFKFILTIKTNLPSCSAVSSTRWTFLINTEKNTASPINNDSNFVITTEQSVEFYSAAINLCRKEESMRRSPASQYMQSPRRPKTEVRKIFEQTESGNGSGSEGDEASEFGLCPTSGYYKRDCL